MLDFCGYWQERIEIDGLTADTANKDLIHLGEVLKTVKKMKRLGLTLRLEGLAYKAGEKSERPPFSDGWIQTKLLDPDALMTLNPEARAIFIGMINSGYRPSETTCAGSNQFCPEADIPHMIIKPREGRAIKNKNSKRVIPLVGVSLGAVWIFPHGFPTYRENDATLSATVNKYLRANGLMENEKHVMYSLRHSFEDRLLRAGVDDRVRRELMGHSLNRERYGQGRALKFKAEMLQHVAF